MRDETWFAGIYDRHRSAVVRYGIRRLGDTDSAEELSQEVFVVAWRRRHDVPDQVLPWLYGVARRLLANNWRAGRAAPQLVEIPATLPAPDDADARARVLDIRKALTELSASDQEVLRLVGWEQLSLAEVAVALGCTRVSAKVRLHRARRRLLAALGPGVAERELSVDAVPAPVPTLKEN